MALLTAIAAGIGLLNPSIYDAVVSPAIRPGVFTQDLLAAALSLVLFGLALSGPRYPLRKRVVAHGILGFLFYAYGIYAIERIYTGLYPLYLAIFGLSLFALIYSIATVPRSAADRLTVRPAVRYLGAGYGLFIAVMFTIIWTGHLIPLLQTADRIDAMYSIYIIDLSFVMPAFVIAALLALRRHPVGLMGIPALFVLGFGILSPLALAEITKPVRYGLPRDMGGFWLYAILSIVFLVSAGVYLGAMRTRPSKTGAAAD